MSALIQWREYLGLLTGFSALTIICYTLWTQIGKKLQGLTKDNRIVDSEQVCHKSLNRASQSTPTLEKYEFIMGLYTFIIRGNTVIVHL